ncbi:GATA transcription factor 26-like isoform X1 [Zingiber officinale]|uniref:GATA transcription factor 26-like isoform X1 n=1 Tax=Zingiber officinale TaxID=94328 RepID=UPI001C4C788A|nr:GATA transcription factor 26-like isoform X1 [Zingiber officinale]
MKKQGPCRHCGVTSTPLWRNGPPEKPVLCNACGSRWRTKGSLINYTPLHAREPFNSVELNVPKIKISFKPKEHKLQKRNHQNDMLESEFEMQYCDQNFCKVAKGYQSNQCSSESEISGSESCVHFDTIEASDITGSLQSNAWDSLEPSKKKMFVSCRKPSPVEKLTKDLHSILSEEQASNLSRMSEDDLLYESGNPFGCSEIGYGGVLIKHPSPKFVEEESEASSFTIDKSYITNNGYSGSVPLYINTERKGITSMNSCIGMIKPTAQMHYENAKSSEKIFDEKLKILQDRSSPLGFADLDSFINFEGFTKCFTYEEQQLLMKYLPAVDTSEPPESLKSMFTCPQFLDTLSCLQQLLREGVYDLSLSGVSAEECRVSKSLVLLNRADSKRSEECDEKTEDASGKKVRGNGNPSRQTIPDFSNFTSLKRDNEKQDQHILDHKTFLRTPKRLRESGVMNPPPKCSTPIFKGTANINDLTNNDGACLTSRTTLPSLSDRSSMLTTPIQSIANYSEGDLLLDLPSNADYAEAELLYHPRRGKRSLNASTTDSRHEATTDGPSSSFQ